MYIDLANDPVKPASFAGEPLEGAFCRARLSLLSLVSFSVV